MKLLAAAAGLLLTMPVALAALVTGPQPHLETAPSAVALEEIPTELLTTYRAAAATCPGLPWQVLAAVGWVESRHAQGRADPATGHVHPPIYGPAIDGRPGFARIPDSSQPDGWARALGPMQFLSTTWARWGRLAPDRPPGATPDVHNAWDAIHSAAAYLCGGGGEVTDLRAALLRYNRSNTYVDQVLAKAADYGHGRGGPVHPITTSGAGELVVSAAMTQLGVPYVWGGASPEQGFDCSGLVQWAYAQIGVTVPRTTSQQILIGVPVEPRQLRAGDLIFSRSIRGGTIVDLGHVAIYAGGGMQIVAPRTGDVVSLRPVNPASIQAIRRVLT